DPSYNAWSSAPVYKVGEIVKNANFLYQYGLVAAPGLSTATSGGTILAGSYQVKVSYAFGSNPESAASLPATIVTTGSTWTITITSPGAATGATGWYAYVTQAGGTSFTRQQAAGSPTAIGTNLTLTAPPTSTGALAPTGAGFSPPSTATSNPNWTLVQDATE